MPFGSKNYSIQYIPNIRFPECILGLIFLKTIKSPESKNYNFQYIPNIRFPESILRLVFLQFQDHQNLPPSYYHDGDNCQHAMLPDVSKLQSRSNISIFTATIGMDTSSLHL